MKLQESLMIMEYTLVHRFKNVRLVYWIWIQFYVLILWHCLLLLSFSIKYSWFNVGWIGLISGVS